MTSTAPTITTTAPAHHTIDTATADHLCGGSANLPAPGGALVIALSDAGQALEVAHTSGGFILRSAAVEHGAWADAFGVLPYQAGRVALSKSPRGPWAASQRRLPGSYGPNV